jgi:Ankyrin repeats (many copies)
MRDEFIRAACAPRDGGHASGTLDRANALLATLPTLAASDIAVAAILGDSEAIAAQLAADPASANAPSAPFDWDPLTHLCFSRYLRLDASRANDFLESARLLLHAGADANTGFVEPEHEPEPTFESALYGAAGIAHHEGLTRLLLQHGANPNDEEAVYHAPEGWDLGAFRALLETGELTPDSLTMMLLRKSDWHDIEGMRLALEHGAEPNRRSRWNTSPLAHAIRSDNDTDCVALLLDHGADPTQTEGPMTPVAMAAWAGRSDLLTLFAQREFSVALEGVNALIAACAQCNAPRVQALAEATPAHVRELLAHSADLLMRFAGVGNTCGVAHLLDLGADASVPHAKGFGYFGIAPQSTPLHVAAWRARHDTVRLLLQRGAAVDVTDGAGRTPLALAVRACVDSYWTERRAPESVSALLAAGANVGSATYPCGYADVDAVLQAHGAGASTR